MKKISIILIIFANFLFCSSDFHIKLNGYPVLDEAHILSNKTINYLNDLLIRLDKNSTTQVSVVTLKSIGDTSIEEAGVQIGRELGLGQKGQDNGVLLLVALDQRKVRIEVGYGLEGALTDYISNKIINAIILPNFKSGNYNAGIKDGVEAIVGVVSGEKFEKVIKKHTHNDIFILIAFLIFFFFIILKSNTMSKKDQKYFYEKNKDRIRTTTGEDALLTSASIFPLFWHRGGRGGGGSSGGFGGGGFSGGGGSFGGGGASGSW